MVIINSKPPAPESLVELMCNCKTDCSTQRCQYKKNYLICTDRCKCLNCMNEVETDTDELQTVLFNDSDSEPDG